MNQPPLISVPSAQISPTRFFLRWRNWPVKFEAGCCKQVYTLVTREDATTFPDQASACRTARAHNLKLEDIQIVETSEPFIISTLDAPLIADAPNAPTKKPQSH